MARISPYDEILIDFVRSNFLPDSRGPANVDECRRCRAQSEMQARIAGGKIAAGGGGKTNLSIHFDARAVPIAIAFCTFEKDAEPVGFAAAIHKNERRTLQACRDYIHPAVIVQVAERGATAGDGFVSSRICTFKAAVVIQRKKRRLQILDRGVVFFDVVEDVSLNDEQVFPAVVIKIFEADAPARDIARKKAKPG